MTTKNVIMLDIDDVLNPSLMRNPRKPGLAGYHKEVYRPEDPFKAWVSPDHGRLLNALDAQVVWATTWVTRPDLLAQYAEASGINPDLPMIDFTEGESQKPDASGKLRGVRKWLEDNDAVDARLVWIDDALAGSDLSWIEDRTSPTKAIKPIPQLGLTLPMYETVMDFLALD